MTLIPAPFLSSAMPIEPGWIDYNGHLNMAYYNVLFDRGDDEAFSPAGLGPDYVTTRQASFMTVEAHICYVRELPPDAVVRVRFRLLDVDDKRAHAFSELVHAEEGWLSATSERMFLHVDMLARKAAPWPADVRERLEAMKAAHAALPWPERAGRRIAMPGRG